MLESSRENNLDNRNPNNCNDAQLNINLLSEYANNNNKKDSENILITIPKIINEETTFTENIEEEIQNNDHTPLIEIKNNQINKNNNETNNNKNFKKIELNLYSSEENNKNNLTNTSISEFRNSNLNKNSFQKIVEENNKEIDKKIIEQKKILFFLN